MVGWIEKPLVGIIRDYRNGKSLERYFSAYGKYKVISIGNYSTNSRYIDNGIRISNEYYDEIARYIPNKNDLTMILNDKTATGDIIGRTLLIDKDDTYVINQRTLLLVLSNEVTAEYLYYFLNSGKTRRYVIGESKPGTQIYVNTPDVFSIPVLLPLLPEQRAIAAALTDADAYIAALEKLIAKKRNLKQGTMQELLTGKCRLPGFEGEWDVVDLDEVAEIIDPHPSHRAPQEEVYGIPFVGIGDISINGTINTNSVRIVSKEIFIEHQLRYNLNDSLLGIGRVASLGKVVKLRPDIGAFAVSPTMAVLKFLAFEPSFAFQYMNSASFQEQFFTMSNGSTRQSVGMNTMRKLRIIKPQLAEQKAIAALLSDMDAEIDILTAKLNKARLIQQGMMGELLTGRIRLT